MYKSSNIPAWSDQSDLYFLVAATCFGEPLTIFKSDQTCEDLCMSGMIVPLSSNQPCSLRCSWTHLRHPLRCCRHGQPAVCICYSAWTGAMRGHCHPFHPSSCGCRGCCHRSDSARGSGDDCSHPHHTASHWLLSSGAVVATATARNHLAMVRWPACLSSTGQLFFKSQFFWESRASNRAVDNLDFWSRVVVPMW